MLEIAKILAILIGGTILTATVMMWTLQFFMRLQNAPDFHGSNSMPIPSEGSAPQSVSDSPEKQITISFDFDGKHVELKGITHLRVAQGSLAELPDSMLTPETSSVG